MEKIDFDLKITDWNTGEVYKVGISRNESDMDYVYEELAAEMAKVLGDEQ